MKEVKKNFLHQIVEVEGKGQENVKDTDEEKEEVEDEGTRN